MMIPHISLLSPRDQALRLRQVVQREDDQPDLDEMIGISSRRSWADTLAH